MAVEVPCPTVEVSNQGLSVRMPGGPILSVAVPQTSPTDLAVAKNLITQANAALAPLAPLFNTIDAVLAVKDFAEAVPDLLTNPSAVVQAVADLVEKVDKLAALVPQLSVPILAVDLIDVIITALSGFIDQLGTIVEQQIKIAAALTTAETPGNEGLVEIAACAQTLNDQVMADLAAGAGPLNQVIGVLNLLLELAGLDPIPDLAEIGDDAEAAIDQLGTVVETLGTLRDAIPVP